MPDDIPIVARPLRTMMIKGLTPSLPEKGKIKIGMRGATRTSKQGNEFQPPQKLDHFLVTTLERGSDNNFKRDEAVHAKVGDKPTSLPVRLLYDDPTLNFPTRYAAYKGRALWCSGDGEQAQRQTADGKSHETVNCPCGRQDPAYTGNDKCKMNGSLGVLLDAGTAGIGGVHKFRTTSYNSIVGLLSTQAYLRAVTGGPLANIPLKLTLTEKQAADPTGKAVTIFVVGLEFDGDVTALQDKGHQIALDRAKTHLSITHIEDEARRLLLAAPTDIPLPGDNNNDIVDEFYPEQVRQPVMDADDFDAPPPRPRRADFVRPEPTLEPFQVTDGDGVIAEYDAHMAAQSHFQELLEGAAAKNELDGLWESNGTFLSQLRDRGYDAQADGLHDIYTAREAELNDAEAQAELNANWQRWHEGAMTKIAETANVERLDAIVAKLQSGYEGHQEWNATRHEALLATIAAHRQALALRVESVQDTLPISEWASHMILALHGCQTIADLADVDNRINARISEYKRVMPKKAAELAHVRAETLKEIEKAAQKG